MVPVIHLLTGFSVLKVVKREKGSDSETFELFMDLVSLWSGVLCPPLCIIPPDAINAPLAKRGFLLRVTLV